MLKASAEPLSEFRIRPKFYLVQMVLILISAQNLLLSLMVAAGAIPCIPPFRSDARANCKLLSKVFMPVVLEERACALMPTGVGVIHTFGCFLKVN